MAIKRALKNKRSSLNGIGTSIAFLGIDGAGKSTTIKLISKIFSKKLTVDQIYMGIPKNSKILFIVNILHRIFKKIKFQFLSNLFFDIQWVLVAYLRYKTFCKARMKKNQGNIVLYDRFPLKIFYNMTEPMDGPRIKSDNYFSKLEKKFYARIQEPDYTIVLKVELAEALKRKKNSDLMRLEEKYNSIMYLAEHPEVFTVDTSKGIQATVKNISETIWNVL